MVVRKPLAGVVFAAAFVVAAVVAPGARAQTPLTVTLCQTELARLYQQIGRCPDEACRRQVQLAIVRHNARCG